jgi:hypothetical protein
MKTLLSLTILLCLLSCKDEEESNIRCLTAIPKGSTTRVRIQITSGKGARIVSSCF